jgi:hypothetical protein
MKWRVMVELTAGDGIVRTHEMSTGGRNTAEGSASFRATTLFRWQRASTLRH